MAKGKKNISDFENALLNNTKILKKQTTNALSASENEIESNLINSSTLKKFNDLSKKYKLETKELIEIALIHFLNMEDVFFKE